MSPERRSHDEGRTLGEAWVMIDQLEKGQTKIEGYLRMILGGIGSLVVALGLWMATQLATLNNQRINQLTGAAYAAERSVQPPAPRAAP